MLFDVRWSTASLNPLLLGTLSWVTILAPAIAAPFDQLEQHCEPQSVGSHDCLDPVPAYSYHLGLQSDYDGDLCLNLGNWEGENKVVVEWDGLQTELSLVGKADVQQYLQPEQREGRSSAIVLYSDQPIMPRVAEQDCGRGRDTNHVTVVSWPQDATDSTSVAQVPEAGEPQASNL